MPLDHTPARFKQAGGGTNDILEFKIMPEKKKGRTCSRRGMCLVWPSVFGRNLHCQPVKKWTPERNAIGHTLGSASSGTKA
jgi:hypothetical protein